jgi:predicted AAA+ superfamily ATPase
VAQALHNKHYGLYYWTTDGTSELDFVLQKGNEIIAVEVKTGTRTKSKSLNMFVTKYKPAYSIRISSKNFGFENNIKSVPLYAVFCIVHPALAECRGRTRRREFLPNFAKRA